MTKIWYICEVCSQRFVCVNKYIQYKAVEIGECLDFQQSAMRPTWKKEGK